jgi:hypothetical protein
MNAGHTTEAQAKIVRDAAKAIAGLTTNPRVMTALMTLTIADDETLAKFARKIR